MGINRMKVKSLNELASLVDKKNISDAATAAGVEAEAEDVEVVVPALERRGGAASAILPSAQQPVQQKSRAPGRGRGRARLPSQSPDAAGCVTPTKAPAGTKRWASLLSPPGATGASAASASGLSIGDERSAADELDIDYKYIQWGGVTEAKACRSAALSFVSAARASCFGCPMSLHACDMSVWVVCVGEVV